MSDWSPFDSIYAPATPSGIAERAVLRLSGPEVWATLSGLLERELPRRRQRLEGGWPLRSGEEHGDEGPGVLLPVDLQIFPGPASYTGEDLIEIHLPSSPLILETVMQALQRRGLRLAWPGEFTRRAFENGKLDLSRVEAVLALIHSRAEADLVRASAVLAGDPGLTMTHHRSELLDVLALLEAGLDFEEGETGEVAEELWRPRIAALAEALASVEGQLGRTTLDLSLPGFLLLGPPNAGKTSLWNFLMKNELQQTELAPGLVSGEAGTTRDLRWLRLPSLGLRLADSPGRELWESVSEHNAQEHAQDDDQERRILEEALSQASGYLWLEPLGAGWQGPPAELPQKPTLCLATRADQGPPGAAEALPAEVQAFSLEDPGMQEQLQESLRRLPGASPMGEAFLALLLGRLHQARDILLGTLDSTLPSPAMVEPEMVAAELRRALALLEPDHAQQVPEEILDRIFGRFCLGK